MDKEQFLLDRLLEAEEAVMSTAMVSDLYRLVMPAIEAMRMSVKMHHMWPTLIEGTKPEMETKYDPDTNSMVYSMVQKMEWMTREAYQHKFGSEAPNSAVINEMLNRYRRHPDFQEEWLR